MLKIKHSGDFRHTEKFFRSMKRRKYLQRLDEYGQLGLDALRRSTPKDSGKTAESWKYRIDETPNGVSLVWYNTYIVDDVPIAILLQYGHGTGTGGYVEGRDYINPALRQIFDEICEQVKWEVRRS